MSSIAPSSCESSDWICAERALLALLAIAVAAIAGAANADPQRDGQGLRERNQGRLPAAGARHPHRSRQAYREGPVHHGIMTLQRSRRRATGKKPKCPKSRQICPCFRPGSWRAVWYGRAAFAGLLVPPAVSLRWPVSCSSAGCPRRGRRSRRYRPLRAKRPSSAPVAGGGARPDALGTHLEQTRAELRADRTHGGDAPLDSRRPARSSTVQRRHRYAASSSSAPSSPPRRGRTSR